MRNVAASDKDTKTSIGWPFSRYLYLLIAMIAFPLFGSIAYQFFLVLNAQQRSAADSALALAQNAAVGIRGFLDDTQQMAALVAGRPQVRSMDPARCDRLLRELHSVLPLHANVSVLDLNMHFVCSARPLPAPAPVPLRHSAFDRALKGQASLSEPVRGILSKRWIVAAAHPVRDDGKRIIGVVTITIDLARLNPFVSTRTVPPGTLASVITNDGVVVARTADAESWVGRDLHEQPLIKKVAASQNETFTAAGLDGIGRIYGVAPVNDQGWRVFVGIPSAVLLSDARERTRAHVVFTTFLVILLALATTVIARRLAGPVRDLDAALKARVGGERTARIPERGPRELVDLARHFNAALNTEQEATECLSGIITSAMDGIITINENREITLTNPAAEEMFGYRGAELLGKPLNTLIPARFHEAHDRHIAEFGRTGVTSRAMGKLGQVVGLRANGEEFPVEASISQLGDSPAKLFTVILRDIAERKQTEDKIRRLNRVYAVLNGINTLIVHARDRQELFTGACRIAVEQGNFGMAWIGMLDPKTLAIIPAAWAGIDSDFIARSQNTAREDVPMGDGLVGRAIRENRAVYSNDLAGEATAGGERRKEAVRRGYHSLIALPLTMDGAVAGNFTLFVRERDFFNEEEIKLLTELAADISFALEHIESQKRIETLSRTRAVSSGINAAIVHARSPQELFEQACRIAVEDGKFGLAWIGSFNAVNTEVTPVAWAGVGTEDLRGHKAITRAEVREGQGTIGRAVRERKPAYSNDITAEPDVGGQRRRKMQRLGCHSVISLPLFTEDAVVAVLVLFATEPDFFTEEEMKLLSELAGNISFALDHIAKQQKLEKLSRIRSVSSEINSTIVRVRERDALLRETCRIAVEHGKFGLVWVGLLDHGKQRIEAVASAGFTSETAQAVNGSTINHPDVSLNEVMRTRRLAVRNDIEADRHAGVLRREAVQRCCRSTVCLPFIVDEQVVAAMNIYAEGPGFFDKDEVALLTEMAGDISFALEHIAKEEKLQYLAYHDPTTGLPNRTMLQERLSQTLHAAKSASQRVAILFSDINRFRYINDTFGRRSGDALLQQLAGRFKELWPDPDDVARVGSNRFASILRDVNEATDIAHLFEGRVEAALRAPFDINGNQINASLSAGIAVFPHDGNDPETLLRNAEAALKEAKETGQRYLFYEPAMNASVAQKLLLENKMRRAVDTGQFVLHYQPKVDLTSGDTIGLEALIRWNDPETGLVPPAQFIPVLEETGMILEAGRWAIRQALADYDRWCTQGLRPPRIAVNVSPIQLKRPDFVDVVRAAIRESKTAPYGLDLEITESLIMDDIEGNIVKLRSLREMGVDVAIDDFGTGYSSLGYLARLPVTALKIDRSFIISMVDSPDSMTIVSTIISLAHSLNLKVIAEGVDAEEQAKFLRLLRCDQIQGYLVSPPVPSEQIPILLSR